MNRDIVSPEESYANAERKSTNSTKKLLLCGFTIIAVLLIVVIGLLIAFIICFELKDKNGNVDNPVTALATQTDQTVVHSSELITYSTVSRNHTTLTFASIESTITTAFSTAETLLTNTLVPLTNTSTSLLSTVVTLSSSTHSTPLVSTVTSTTTSDFATFTSTTYSGDSDTTVSSSTPTTTVPATEKPSINTKCNKLRQCKKNFKHTPLLIISFDGFRNSYLQMNITPHIQQLFECGTHSKFMLPSFPSKTFPNHYSIATGLYPAWHGIVDNSFRDLDVPGGTFTQGTKSEGWFLGEPIWKTVQRFGLKSAVYFWPGSESPDKLPNYYEQYDSSVPFTARADKIVEWLKMDDENRPTLLQLYMEEPDSGGHVGGPDSQQVRTGMIMMDGIVKYLTERLIDEGLMGCINMVLLSDHGMQQLDMKRAVIMSKFLPQNFDGSVFSGVIGHIAVNDMSADLDMLVNGMKCLNGTDYLVYKTPLTPARFHYGGSKRNGELIIQGRPGVFVMKDEQEFERRKSNKGNHGFDNRLPSMRAIFAAFGPDVVENQEIPEFQNIELYNLFCDLLKITPSPNNGTRGQLYSVLKNPPQYTDSVVQQVQQCTNNLTIIKCNEDCPNTSSISDNCAQDTETVHFESGFFDGCIISLCDGVIHYNKETEKVEMIETTISMDDWNTQNDTCSTDVAVRNYSCNDTVPDRVSLFLNKDIYKTLEIAKVPVTKGFITEIWNPFLTKVQQYLKFYGKISLYAGVGYDRNADSLRDTRQQDLNKPTHIHVTLLRCLDTLNGDRHNCKTPDVLSFIFTIVDDDFNCLPKEDYFFENTARIRDVELLSGAEFFRDRNVWSKEQSIYLRTQLAQELWP